MSDYRDFEEERIGPENFWLVKVLLVIVLLLFAIMTISFLSQGEKISNAFSNEKTAACDNGFNQNQCWT